MKKITLVIALFFVYAFAKAQTTDPGLLVNIQKASQAEINAYPAAELEIGMLVYNTDVNRIYEYTDTGFLEILTEGSNSYAGAFIITTASTGTNPPAALTFTQTITATGITFKPSQITAVAHANVEAFTQNAGNATNNGNTPDFFTGVSNGFARQTGATITQQVINSGQNSSSVNDLSTFSSPTNCIGMRYANSNGDFIGSITANVTAFTDTGFTISVTYTPTPGGTVAARNRVFLEDLVVLYTATR